MTQILTLELPDEVYAAVKQAAEATGRTPSELLAERIRQQFPISSIPAEQDERPLRALIPEAIRTMAQQIAATSGRSPEEIIAEFQARIAPRPRPQLSEEEWEAARQRLLRHAGAASSGDSHSADNDRIDEDLVREYASPHEVERDQGGFSE